MEGLLSRQARICASRKINIPTLDKSKLESHSSQHLAAPAYCLAKGVNVVCDSSPFNARIAYDLPSARRVYGGYSAGVCVLSPSLWGIHLADEPEVRPAGYPAEAIWEGLNLIPFYVAPHDRSDHVESAAIKRTVAYYIEHKLPFVALRDGEALTLDDRAPWDYRLV